MRWPRPPCDPTQGARHDLPSLRNIPRALTEGRGRARTARQAAERSRRPREKAGGSLCGKLRRPPPRTHD
eukprot:8639315-Alexandrium_andersonii.AAC.1